VRLQQPGADGRGGKKRGTRKGRGKEYEEEGRGGGQKSRK